MKSQNESYTEEGSLIIQCEICLIKDKWHQFNPYLPIWDEDRELT